MSEETVTVVEVQEEEPSRLAGTAGHSRFSALAASTWALGERVSWDVAVQLVPTPQGPRPMLLVYLATPSALVGQLVGEPVLVEPQNVTWTHLNGKVRAAVERLRQGRSRSALQTAPTVPGLPGAGVRPQAGGPPGACDPLGAPVW